MLGAVAIGYFFAAALAMAVACAGPDARAKFCSGYLMCAWGLTNRIFLTNSPEDALQLFSVWDLSAVLVIYVTMLAWPTRWIAVLLAALTTQVIFQLYYRITGERLIAHYAVNEAMYVVQLVSVTIPTLTKWLRIARRLARRRRMTRERGVWPPPTDYRVGGGEVR